LDHPFCLRFIRILAENASLISRRQATSGVARKSHAAPETHPVYALHRARANRGKRRETSTIMQNNMRGTSLRVPDEHRPAPEKTHSREKFKEKTKEEQRPAAKERDESLRVHGSQARRVDIVFFPPLFIFLFFPPLPFFFQGNLRRHYRAICLPSETKSAPSLRARVFI